MDFRPSEFASPAPPPRSAGGEHIWFSGNLMTILHADGWTMLESNMRAGHAPPLHIHRSEDEAFYLFDGSLSFRHQDVTLELTAGDSLVVKAGTPHAFRVGPRGARALQIATGTGLAGFIRDAGRPAPSPTLPPEAPDDREAVVRAAARHDMVVVGPPLRAPVVAGPANVIP